MKITRTSMVSGITRTLELNVTKEQLQRCADGEKIQNVMPKLTPSEREFIITGITDDEWDATFSEEGFDDIDELVNELGANGDIGC